MKKIVILTILFLFQGLSSSTQNTDYVPAPEALHQAASLLDEVRVIELINDYQFPINQPDSRGWLPIHYAAFPDLQNLSNMPADEQRIRQLSIINLLSSTLTSPTVVSGRSVMHLVASSGNVYLANVLHHYNNQLITLRDLHGDSPLHHAAYNDQTPMIAYFVDMLDVAVDVRNNFGRTPLHSAIESGSEHAIRSLIRRNASIYISDNEGFTALDRAEAYDRQHNNAINATDSVTSLLIREYMLRHGKDLFPEWLATIIIKQNYIQTISHMIFLHMFTHMHRLCQSKS